MNKQNIYNTMFKTAKELLENRYPTGWGCACVIRTEKEHYLTSTYCDGISESAALCYETGAICEAHKINECVTHCLSVTRETTNSEISTGAPCGICQERLWYWGENVEIVFNENNKFYTKTLLELQPYHWSKENNNITNYFIENKIK